MSWKQIDNRTPPLITYLKKVWEYRNLIVSLARRDLKIKYAQTALGLFWTFLQPLVGLAIFGVFFGLIMPVDTGNIPYPLFAFTGIMAWYFFSYMIYQGGNSLITAQELIHSMYFPRLVLPLTKVLSGLVEFCASLIIMVVLLVVLGVFPGWQIIFLPIFILFNIITGLTFSLFLCAVTIRNRDLQHIIPYIVNFGIWLTPVFYPTTILPPAYDWIMYLNPMAAVIAGYRWTFLGGAPPDLAYLGTLAGMCALFILTIWYFRKAERTITDFV